MATQFVCDSTNERFAAFIKEKDTKNKEWAERLEFLKRQAKAMDKERAEMWINLWKGLQADGLIDPALDYENYGMETNPKTGQLFIERKDADDDIGSLLKNLLK